MSYLYPRSANLVPLIITCLCRVYSTVVIDIGEYVKYGVIGDKMNTADINSCALALSMTYRVPFTAPGRKKLPPRICLVLRYAVLYK